MKRCACCKQEKTTAEFYSRRGGGHYAYCRECVSAKSKAYYAQPMTRARVKQYYARPEVIKREQSRRVSSPRNALSISLNRALKRCKVRTDKPATIADLMALWHAQNGLCALSGVYMTWRSGKPTNTSISIDRIEQTKGYSADNLRLICWALNRFRGDGTDEQMLEIARALVLNLGPQRKELGGVTALAFL